MVEDLRLERQKEFEPRRIKKGLNHEGHEGREVKRNEALIFINVF